MVPGPSQVMHTALLLFDSNLRQATAAKRKRTCYENSRNMLWHAGSLRSECESVLEIRATKGQFSSCA